MKRIFFGLVLVNTFAFCSIFAEVNNKVDFGARAKLGFQAEKSCAEVEIKNNTEKKQAAVIILENPVMGIIDGGNMGINANTYGLILKSRRDVRKRHYGLAENAKVDAKKIGYYDLQGSKKTLLDLVEMEKAAIASNDINMQEALKQLLNWAKEDFISITIEYLDSAKGMKDPLLTIITEFHSKSGLGDFFLLDWGRTKDGGEVESIRKNVKSFNDLHVLFTEMEGFLEAMARSCKKGKKLFEKMVEDAKSKTN